MDKMNNASIIGLNFFEPVNGFKEQPEAKQPGNDQQQCEHDWLFSEQ